jgi:hypothetical protein
MRLTLIDTTGDIVAIHEISVKKERSGPVLVPLFRGMPDIRLTLRETTAERVTNSNADNAINYVGQRVQDAAILVGRHWAVPGLTGIWMQDPRTHKKVMVLFASPHGTSTSRLMLMAEDFLNGKSVEYPALLIRPIMHRPLTVFYEEKAAA